MPKRKRRKQPQPAYRPPNYISYADRREKERQEDVANKILGQALRGRLCPGADAIIAEMRRSP